MKRFGLTEYAFLKHFFFHDIYRFEFRRERLQYVRFLQEVTDAILRNNLTTETAIEKLYEIHIDRNRGTLDEVRIFLVFSQDCFYFLYIFRIVYVVC